MSLGGRVKPGHDDLEVGYRAFAQARLVTCLIWAIDNFGLPLRLSMLKVAEISPVGAVAGLG